ncbi:selenide, water dikinase SelD [Sinorhizobium sp. 7-81]|uniref:selenide, water dikinase SelD n=1 Tax=Sinorhizobium sp. 8-89 TaxID=3049089 RepID=UPI0024C30846|nr:selenide, water dikinase SelD [Sinorhizobium sp. 8-89]MDK1493675.1 selenide, water dikinase SelD [Sinorhizobium sp. 8-89]
MDSSTATPPFRLTALAHGGGCGCKLAPSVLQQLLADQPAGGSFARLLVGTETGDDAAVWQLDDETCVIATTDFFMPMVDDPFDFGRIAAANAISDVYAMGGKPIMALAILGMPIDKMPAEMVREILKGGSAICAEAGIPVAGGHSIDSPEPIYGLAVIGTGSTANIRRNSGAEAGDALILTKALGVGIYSAAFKKGALPADAYAELIASTTLLNRIGAELAKHSHVHAVTDVTGFGILGHALEMARGSNKRIAIDADAIALFSHCSELAEQGFVTGASHRNWASYGMDVALPDDLSIWRRHILTDPQTSGGLLVSCRADQADALLEEIVAAGYPAARIIGAVEEGEPGLRVTA